MASNQHMITFTTKDIGFVVYLGMGLWNFSPHDAGSIWRSTDGGQTWSKVLSNGYIAIAISPPDFVAAVGRDGRFATSQDAGRAWTEARLDGTGDIVSVTVVDSSYIAIATTTGRLLLSTNRGASWVDIQTPRRDFETLDLETTGPGKIWLLQRPTESAIRTEAYYAWLNEGELSNADDKANWYAAENRLLRQCLHYTNDGGRNWVTTDAPPYQFDALRKTHAGNSIFLKGRDGVFSAESVADSIGLNRISPDGWCCDVVDRDVICRGGYNGSGVLWTTHDGGTSWHEETITDNGVISVFLLDSLHGWALVGSYGGDMMWGTVNGGQSWSRLIPPRPVESGGTIMTGLSSPFS
jgi:hypothetical protein